MHIRITVTAGRDPVDLLVSAAPGAPLSSVAADLRAAVGRDGPIFAGAEPLSPDAALGSPPLLDGALLAVGAPGPDEAAAYCRPAMLVVGGPDAGGIRPLGAGETRIGRGAAELRLADPDVSRRHAVLGVVGDSVWVRDVGSTNGSTVDGIPLASEPVPLPPGAVLRVGESSLVLARLDDPPAAVRPDGAGHLLLNRPPRLRPPDARTRVDLPGPPERPQPVRLPLAAVVAPLVIGAGLALWQPQFALLMVLSPLALATNAVADRLVARRRYRKAYAAHRRDRATAELRLANALAVEARQRRVEHPDPATLLATSRGPRPGLWERRSDDPDALEVRVGTADLPAVRVVTGTDQEPARPDGPPPGGAELTVAAVPMTVPLREIGVLGLAGARPVVLGLARYVLAQLAGLHSPRELELAVLCADDRAAADWAWARWLPHLRDGEHLRYGSGPAGSAQLAAQLLARPSLGPGLRTLVLVDGAAQLRTLPDVVRVLQRDRPEILAVCLAGDPLELPAECGATAVVAGASARLVVRRAGRSPVGDVVADRVSLTWAERFARALAPVRDATADQAGRSLPTTRRLLDLLSLAAPTPEAVAERWRSPDPATRAVLGAGPAGRFAVDLRRDGPHALVAGTTGSGKSELLRTLVCSLAAANRPDQLCFVLVDYKGGAAFAPCAALPHCAGLVTDLDAALARRALAALDAELVRRERMLGAAGVAELDDYTRGGSALGPLPRMVIVVDEYATLAHELPDFVAGLVDIARRGRSLGVHLVLATQRPGGVVSAEIRRTSTCGSRCG